ncbi:hypothetical protein ACTJK5_09770 [Agrobacterium sp. 22094]|uniref:hypothetical protein n=1 Tax=Agrobacterium sp. 22094 TaxID=3453872 RepID=UPI003F83BD3F
MKKNWWNPLTWLAGIWGVFSSIVGGFLRLFGLRPPTPRMQHENLQVEDVDRAYNDAAAAENIDDFAPEIDQRAHGFLRYIESSPAERAAFDLSVFDERLQDFILGLSEDDIEELRRRGPVGQLQAALIGRIPAGMEMKAAPDVRPEPSKADLVRKRFLAAVRGLPQDDADGYSLDYAPSP